jgi:hypothetical protein
MPLKRTTKKSSTSDTGAPHEVTQGLERLAQSLAALTAQVSALAARVERLEKTRVRSGWDDPQGPRHEPSGG